ncbi:hypothetical protein [Azonexus sp.]|jgi:hypothetical protein|uniref:hypothetical protein n=1 Tax=Azonexus sp. TaxID=1872668 RepID=UPI00282402F8|nr:hypothetical protein [Azonexus sp.]MDR1995120.1 hypothetical protein [Azonexus sp.]
MDKEIINLGLSVANFILTWGIALYMYLSNKNKATNARITLLEGEFSKRIEKLDDDIGGKLDSHIQRITKLETSSEKAPSHADLAKVYTSINELASTVNQLVGENRVQSNTLRLILNQITAKGMQ